MPRHMIKSNEIIAVIEERGEKRELLFETDASPGKLRAYIAKYHGATVLEFKQRSGEDFGDEAGLKE